MVSWSCKRSFATHSSAFIVVHILIRICSVYQRTLALALHLISQVYAEDYLFEIFYNCYQKIESYAFARFESGATKRVHAL
jgi:F0F1-type ATP synthase membrane subunit a